jgi:hypothetical protein
MALRVRMGRTRAETQRAQSGGDLLATPAIGLVGCKRRILGHRGHRGHREILPSTRQPPLQPDFFQIGKELCLCVLGDLCGKNLLTRARPKISLCRNASSPDPDGEDSRRGAERGRFACDSGAIGLVGWKRRILSHRGHRVHREILPSTRQPPLQPDFFQIGKDLCLCVLGDLCGKN